ncbi:Os06g0338801, partial [Oryza sativa Japonica Group]
VAPCNIAGVPLEHTDDVLRLHRLAVRVDVITIHVGGVGWVISLRLQRDSRDAKAVLTGVHECVEVPLLLRVHIWHEDLRGETAVENPPP